MPLERDPGSIKPGHLTSNGTRYPPSQFVFFSPLKGAVPPSGQVNFSAPLSVVYITTVLSVMPSSSSLSSIWPIMPSCSTIPSGNTPKPVTPSDSGFKRVCTCIRVVLYQRKKGLSALTALSRKSNAAAVTSSSIVSIRFFVSGPVSSMRPSAEDFMTPLGPNFSRNAGSFG